MKSIVFRLGFLLFAVALMGEVPVRNIREFGAVPDGRTLNSGAINRAIAAAAGAGGGTVLVPSGRFLTGTIYLKSHVTLHLEKGAELVGSTNLGDYPLNAAPAPQDTVAFRRIRHLYPANLEYGRYSLIYADQQADIAVTGQGRIIGQGDHPNLNKRLLRARGVPEREAYLNRPYGICFVGCTGVKVRDIAFENMAFWCQDYLDCDGVFVDGVSVDSKQMDANNDGIDLDGSRHVRVSNCRFNSGDDSICLKASYRDCEDITITDCAVSSFANGVKFGTASNGGFRNIAIARITMEGVNCAGLALEIVDGGTMDGVVVEDLTMRRVGTALFVRLGDRGNRWKAPGSLPAVGTLRNITISNVDAILDSEDNRPLCSSITGLPGHAVENVTLRNIRIHSLHSTTPAEAAAATLDQVQEHAEEYPEYSMFGALPSYGLFVRHARGITLQNCRFDFQKADYRSAIVCEDVENFVTNGVKTGVTPGGGPIIFLRHVKGALLQGGWAPPGTEAYLRLEGRTTGVALRANDLKNAKTPVSGDEGLMGQVSNEAEPSPPGPSVH